MSFVCSLRSLSTPKKARAEGFEPSPALDDAFLAGSLPGNLTSAERYAILAPRLVHESYQQYRVINMNQVFESSRISFVEVTELLVNDYLTMVNDYENVNRFIGGNHKTYTAEQELKWVQEKLEEKAFVFSMLEKKSGQFIGNIELIDVNNSVGELGIAITAAKQNSGYGTEAVFALTEYGTRQLGLKRVFLRTNPQNNRAIHVYQKCSFKEYDRTDEHIYMELSR